MIKQKQDWRDAINAIRRWAVLRSLQRDRKAWRKYHRNAIRRAQKWRSASRRRQAQGREKLLDQLGSLKRDLATIEQERDAVRGQVEALQSTLAEVPHVKRRLKSNQPLFQFTAALGLVGMLGALAGVTTSLDQRDTLLDSRQHMNFASMESEPASEAQLPVGRVYRDIIRQKLAQENNGKRRYRYRRPAEHRQWGPPMLLPDAVTAGPGAGGVDPQVKDQQSNLISLGFDLAKADGIAGTRTRQALQEFTALYIEPAGNGDLLDEQGVAVLTGIYADMARNDAKKYPVDRGVLAAIRLASVRTGVEFSYLMELAAAESAFNPAAQASGSSAAGLYQFTNNTWLNVIKAHGHKYGLGHYADSVEYSVTRSGYRVPKIRDERIYKHVLALRKNPRVAAMMAAESVKDSLEKLAHISSGETGRTELYLTHFFGAEGAKSFLQVLDHNPSTPAADIFPEAAQSNQSIFHPETCEPRTVAEVYEIFSEKFHTRRFDWER